jgi:hypothetical protein
MLALARKAGSQLIRRRFDNLAELNAAVYASLVDFLEATGALRTTPFDKTPGRDASAADPKPKNERGHKGDKRDMAWNGALVYSPDNSPTS